jgi:putative NIF3 family GTP cyclohydrolase 1 type 2
MVRLLKTFVSILLQHNNCSGYTVRVATASTHGSSNNQAIKTVAICAGSGSDVLSPVKADLYFSGEMGHHDVLAALAQETSVILCRF